MQKQNPEVKASKICRSCTSDTSHIAACVSKSNQTFFQVVVCTNVTNKDGLHAIVSEQELGVLFGRSRNGSHWRRLHFAVAPCGALRSRVRTLLARTRIGHGGSDSRFDPHDAISRRTRKPRDDLAPPRPITDPDLISGGPVNLQHESGKIPEISQMDRDLGHLRREARRTFHRIPVWISPTGECNLELGVRAHNLVVCPLRKLFPRRFGQWMSVTQLRQVSSVGVTAVTAELDLDEARFPLQIDAHIRN